ncbi:MAG: hypothetical protein N2Z75_02355 [Meiothermus sp.]|nr:hypothetical protein [Meiothermus sp.]
MNINENVWKTIGRGAVHPSEVLNTLIELDNRKGQIGLWALENELREKMPLLRPSARLLAQAWLEATVQYRTTYYPETRLTRLWNRLVGAEAPSEARTLPLAS